MLTQIEQTLANIHPETNYALFSVHEVRALVATVNILTEGSMDSREPLLIFGLHPSSPPIPLTAPDSSLAYRRDYQLTINGRYIGTFNEVYWQALMEVMHPLHIPVAIQLHNSLNHGHTEFRSK